MTLIFPAPWTGRRFIAGFLNPANRVCRSNVEESALVDNTTYFPVQEPKPLSYGCKSNTLTPKSRTYKYFRVR